MVGASRIRDLMKKLNCLRRAMEKGEGEVKQDVCISDDSFGKCLRHKRILLHSRLHLCTALCFVFSGLYPAGDLSTVHMEHLSLFSELYRCVCVCVCVSVYICMCVCVCVFGFTSHWIKECMCMYVCVYSYTYMNTYMCVYIYTHRSPPAAGFCTWTVILKAGLLSDKLYPLFRLSAEVKLDPVKNYILDWLESGEKVLF